MGRRDDKDFDKPRAAGWYPDPWRATGEGERLRGLARLGTQACFPDV